MKAYEVVLVCTARADTVYGQQRELVLVPAAAAVLLAAAAAAAASPSVESSWCPSPAQFVQPRLLLFALWQGKVTPADAFS